MVANFRILGVSADGVIIDLNQQLRGQNACGFPEQQHSEAIDPVELGFSENVQTIRRDRQEIDQD